MLSSKVTSTTGEQRLLQTLAYLMGWPGWHVPPLGLWNFHQPVKELKSAGKIFIECPYDFASEVRYTVNVRKFELVKKKCATPVILPQIRLCLYSYLELKLSVWTGPQVVSTTARHQPLTPP